MADFVVDAAAPWSNQNETDHLSSLAEKKKLALVLDGSSSRNITAEVERLTTSTATTMTMNYTMDVKIDPKCGAPVDTAAVAPAAAAAASSPKRPDGSPAIVLPFTSAAADRSVVEVTAEPEVDDLAANHAILEACLLAMPSGYPFHSSSMHLCRCSAMPGPHTHTMPQLARIPLNTHTWVKPPTAPAAASSAREVARSSVSPSPLAASGSDQSATPVNSGVHRGTNVLGPNVNIGTSHAGSSATRVTAPAPVHDATVAPKKPWAAEQRKSFSTLPLTTLSASINHQPLHSINLSAPIAAAVKVAALSNVMAPLPPVSAVGPLPSPSSSQKKKVVVKDTQATDASCQSLIECGEMGPSGKRSMTAHVEFFGKEVEIYTAASDSHRSHLYRASALAEKFGYATNKVGMYLARRRSAMSGIYQATSFRAKPPGRTGLKAGGYFLTIGACLEFQEHFQAHDHVVGHAMASNAGATYAYGGQSATTAIKKQSQSHAHSADNELEDSADEAMSDDEDAPPKEMPRATGLGASEAEASANLALLAQFTPPAPEKQLGSTAGVAVVEARTTSTAGLASLPSKKRTATSANLHTFSAAQRLIESSTMGKPRVAIAADSLRSNGGMPMMSPHLSSLRKADALAVPTSRTPMLEYEAYSTAPMTMIGGGADSDGLTKYAVAIKAEENAANMRGLEQEILAHQQHAQYQQHIQQQHQHFHQQQQQQQHMQVLAAQQQQQQHALTPPGRQLYSYPGTPSYTTGSYGQSVSSFNPTSNGTFVGHANSPMVMHGLPQLPPQLGSYTYQQSPSMLMPPPSHMSLPQNGSNLLSSGFPYHQSSSVQMHGNQPVLQISYNIQLMPEHGSGMVQNGMHGGTMHLPSQFAQSPNGGGLMPFATNQLYSPGMLMSPLSSGPNTTTTTTTTQHLTTIASRPQTTTAAPTTLPLLMPAGDNNATLDANASSTL